MSPYELTWARFSLKDHGSAISGGRQAVQHCRHKSDYIYTRQKGKLQGRKLRVFLTRLASYRCRLCLPPNEELDWASIGLEVTHPKAPNADGFGC